MILADKIILQRKKNGWSQEELAEKMEVSRQSVSKWEAAQSVPDLGKVIRLAQLFQVSTDYLLKDEMEDVEFMDEVEEQPSRRVVTMEEANAFLQAKEKTAKKIAGAVTLCIWAVIPLIFLGAASETSLWNLSEDVAGVLGLFLLIIMIIPAVAIFIYCGSITAPYEYLEKEVFETAYGVSGMVKEKKRKYTDSYTKSNIIGTCLCILALLPLFAAGLFEEEDFYAGIAVCILLALVSIGAYIIVRVGIPWSSYEKLLQEGDYSHTNKEKSPIIGAVSTIYWLIATAIYLGYSFATNDWQFTWVVWPVAGVLYGAVAVLVEALWKSKK